MTADNYDKVRKESPSPSPVARSPAAQPVAAPTFPSQSPLSNASDPSQVQAQEEYLRSILRAQGPEGNGSQTPQGEEDPMMKMLQSIMGGMDPSDPNGGEMPSISPDDISKATGIPSWATSMLFGKTPETEQQKRQTFIWKIIHAVFALLVGVYMLWTVNGAMASFGAKPPAPPTVRNPFILFVVGELLVETTRITMRGMGSPKGIGAWYQIAKDIGRDGSVVIFLLGMYMWWNK